MSQEPVVMRLKKNKFEVKIPYAGGDGPRLVKVIAGRWWDRDSKTWLVPQSWENAVRIRSIANDLGAELKMSDGVRAWGHAERQARATKAVLVQDQKEARTGLSRVQELFPEMWSAMSSRPFQMNGVEFMANRQGSLLADDPGLGKTLQTLATFVEVDARGPILIVANKSAAEITWPNEIRKWLPGDKVFNYGAHMKPAQRKAFWEEMELISDQPSERVWVVMNPYWVRAKAEVDEYGKFVRTEKGQKIVSAVTPAIFGIKWAGIVADESHETLACNTGNAKKWSQQRQGMGLLECKGPKISISGTPMRGKPENLFGQLQWIAPSEYSGFWKWAKKHFAVTDDGYGGALQIGALVDEKLFYEEAAEYMIRREKGEVAPDLPPKMYGGTEHPDGDVVGVWLPMLPEQKKQYDHFVANQSIVTEEGQLDAIGALAMYTRMKQLSGSCARVGSRKVKMPMIDEAGRHLKDSSGNKLYEVDPSTGEPVMIEEEYLIPRLPSNKYEWLKEWLEERDLLGKGAKGKGKVIIASQFRQLIDLVGDDLAVTHKTKSFAITGATSAKARVSQQDEFQSNPNSEKIFFVQTKAGGTSLTLDMADDVVILDETWNPDEQLQVEDRAHRLSRAHNVSIWYPRSLDTVEEYIGTTVAERNRVMRAVLDGARGVDVRRQLLHSK